EIVLNQRLTTIQDQAFIDCSSLETIILPSTVTTIGSLAFKNCSKLSEFKLPNSITQIAADIFEGTAIAANQTGEFFILDGILLEGKQATGDIQIPSTVYCIANGAFKNNSSIVKVTIPESVTLIGTEAFNGCTSLESVDLPVTLKRLSEGAFGNCTSLTSIAIPPLITELSDYTFYNCSSLSEFTLPDTLTRIGNRSFEKCSSLSVIKFPNHITSIGEYAFSECNSLKKLIIPMTVTDLGESVFSACKSLVKVKVSSENIASRAFEECPKLASVIMTSEVKTVGESAFKNCTALKSVILSKNITCIEYHLFAECSKLEYIILPNSVEYILDGAFSNCTKLKEINMPRNNCYIDENAFTPGKQFDKLISDKEAGFATILDDIVNPSSLLGSSTKAIQTEDAVYYLSGDYSYRTSYTLYKQSKDAEDSTKIASISGPDFILYGNYIYYLNEKVLQRVTTSGKAQENLVKKVVKLLAIQNNYIYYVSGRSLYRSGLNGENQKLILTMPTKISYYHYDFKFSNNKIYYVADDHNSKNIESIGLDGKDHHIMVKNITIDEHPASIYASSDKIYYETEDSQICSVDDSGKIITYTTGRISEILNNELYYYDNSGLCKITTEGTKKLVLSQQYLPKYGDDIMAISQDGNWIACYYVGADDSESGYLYLVDLDKKKSKLIATVDTMYSDCSLIGDYVYYGMNYDYENGPDYRIRTRFK
ncbi:MAG: leucine-rich repeat protein, partial [Mobilitalea sp.]